MPISIPTGPVKLRIDPSHVFPATITEEGPQLVIQFGFNDYLRKEIKSMDGAKWLGIPDDPNPRKAWGVRNTERNKFRLAYLMDMQPYAPYDAPIKIINPRRKHRETGQPYLYNHQMEIASHIHTRHQCIVAGEMGVGKTLAAIEAMEASGIHDWFWVGPRSAIDSVRYEFYNWQVCSTCGKFGKHHRNENHKLTDSRMILPKFMTYESLKGLVETWPAGSPAPRGVIMDECSRVKTPTSQRSQAAKALADSMRADHGMNAYIVLMSGSPAPKDPSDWWHLGEIACPGFIREGNLQKFKQRLCLIKQYEGAGGGTFPKLITWWDDSKKCGATDLKGNFICGKFQDDPDHSPISMTESWYHEFQPSRNEVAGVYERLRGLVVVKFKKDCLDLPEKVYRTEKCKPTPSVLRAASLIAQTASSTIKALTLLRELSDGFQYKEVEKGVEECPTCNGRLKINRTVDLDDPLNPLDAESLTRGYRVLWDDNDIITGQLETPLNLGIKEIECTQCGGTGEVPKYEREAVVVPCPKDDKLKDLLEQYEDEGRVVMWAGFTESIDRCTRLCLEAGWPVVRLDGRGWYTNTDVGSKIGTDGIGFQILQAFDDKVKYPKIAFIGQPGAGGMGLNLTASSVEIYYSNTFKYEDRAQSEDRIHRPGADHNRGCTIIDLIHLPQDLWVLENLKRKRDLQAMTLGMLAEAADKFKDETEERVA